MAAAARRRWFVSHEEENWSGRQDSNLRPPHPQPQCGGCLVYPGLRCLTSESLICQLFRQVSVP
jgi:hypothetical protein